MSRQDQAQIMQAIAGNDPTCWRDRIGLFGPGSRLANDAGTERLTGPRDYDSVRRALIASGYDGRPIVLLSVAAPYFREAADVAGDQLRKAGLKLDMQVMDFPTSLRRRDSTEPPGKGGWNAVVSLTDGLFIDNPATNNLFRGDPRAGVPSLPVSPRLEGLRAAWLQTEEPAAQKQLARDLQSQLWEDVPYIPLGSWVRATAHRRDIVDLPWGYAAFYGVRRV